MLAAREVSAGWDIRTAAPSPAPRTTRFRRNLTSTQLLCAPTGSTSRSSLEGVCESVQRTRWGADEDSTSRARVLETVSLAAREQLKETEVGAVEGDWELLWTTEASVHSIIRATASFAPVHRVTQCINFTESRVSNAIEFGAFGLQLQASGPLRVLSGNRIAYGFDRLRFTLGGADGLALPLPVPAAARAGGWTSLAALALLRDGSALRVMVNSRGDTLILQRSPSSAS